MDICIRFDVLTAVHMRCTIPWDITLCSACLCLPASLSACLVILSVLLSCLMLTTVATNSSETSANFH
jgi:hypothetical protein